MLEVSWRVPVNTSISWYCCVTGMSSLCLLTIYYHHTRNTTQYYAPPRTTTHHHAAPRNTTQHHAASRSITQHHAALRTTIQHHAAPLSTPKHTVSSSAANTILYVIQFLGSAEVCTCCLHLIQSYFTSPLSLISHRDHHHKE